MSELSVFVDESGDFGALAAHCPFYIVSLVVHDQDEPIDAQLGRLEKVMRESGFDRYGPVHTAPLIRREAPYSELDGRQRRRMFDALFAFSRRCSMRHKVILVDKRWFGDGDALEERIARELGEFLRENISFFQSYDRVIVYYDRGQKEISRTLRVVAPADYVLFQVADLCCTIELVERRRTERGLTKSEAAFFGGAGSFKKTYLKEFRR